MTAAGCLRRASPSTARPRARPRRRARQQQQPRTRRAPSSCRRRHSSSSCRHRSPSQPAVLSLAPVMASDHTASTAPRWVVPMTSLVAIGTGCLRGARLRPAAGIPSAPFQAPPPRTPRRVPLLRRQPRPLRCHRLARLLREVSSLRGCLRSPRHPSPPSRKPRAPRRRPWSTCLLTRPRPRFRSVLTRYSSSVTGHTGRTVGR